MHKLRLISLTLALAIFSGCSALVGTWTAAPASDGAKSPIAKVSFVCDGTFTAQAEYGGSQSHAAAGHWKLEDGKLKLSSNGTDREYDVDVSGDQLTITHGGKTYSMTKMK